MVRCRMPTALARRGSFRRRRPSWISNCWLLASCSSCQGFLLPYREGKLPWNIRLDRCDLPHSTRVFSTATSTASGQRRVCILHDEEETNNHHSSVAKQLSESLALPIVTSSELAAPREDEEAFTHILCLENYPESLLPEEEQYALAIQPVTTTDKKSKRRRSKKPAKIKPFYIDLCPPTPTQRSGQPDLLVRAVAPQKVAPRGAVVYDLTAGWAQDSLLLALGGASRVCMVERDPIVARLLKDALRRVECVAQQPKSTFDPWQQRAEELHGILGLREGDALEVLRSSDALDPPPDIFYLDPMFPPRTKSAAVKKGMQILHGLFETNRVPNDEDAAVRDQEEAELLQLAYEKARVKVVVKRPIHAPLLGNEGTNLKPSHVVKGSINRWDVYVKT